MALWWVPVARADLMRLRWSSFLVSLCILLVGIWMTVQESLPATVVPTPAATMSVTPEPIQAPASPSARPDIKATPSASVKPIPIPPAAPVSVSVPELGFWSEVGQESVANMGGVINPPITGYPWQTYWVTDKGVAPGSNSPDTTYLACHTSSKKSDAQAPCNKLSRNQRVEPGHHVVVKTTRGTLTYQVESARTVLRDDFATDEEVWRVDPNRIVWVMCYITNQRTDYNYVVFARLVEYESNERG